MRHLEFAPAKLNLWLKVQEKREDGYHEIETLIVPIATIKDDLHFDLNLGEGELIFECNDTSLGLDCENLVLQALNAFQCETGNRVYGKIRLVKRIPIGAKYYSVNEIENIIHLLTKYDRKLKTTSVSHESIFTKLLFYTIG